MPDSEIIAAVRNKYQALRPVLDEKVRRRWAACEAMAIGWGGITAVAEATGLSRPTIRAGLAEVRGGASDAEEDPDAERQRLRQVGGGRRRVTESDPGLQQGFASLVGGVYAWGSAVASAVDQPKHPASRRGPRATRPPREPPHRRSVARGPAL